MTCSQGPSNAGFTPGTTAERTLASAHWAPALPSELIGAPILGHSWIGFSFADAEFVHIHKIWSKYLKAYLSSGSRWAKLDQAGQWVVFLWHYKFTDVLTTCFTAQFLKTYCTWTEHFNISDDSCRPQGCFIWKCRRNFRHVFCRLPNHLITCYLPDGFLWRAWAQTSESNFDG